MRSTIVLGFVAMATGAIYLARARMQSYRQSSVRDGLAQFTAAFRGRDIPPELLKQTYDHLVERREAVGEDNAAHFIVAPGHDLRSVYHLDGIDIEDAVLVIADRANARLPKVKELDALKGRVSTVQDLVTFLVPFFETAELSKG